VCVCLCVYVCVCMYVCACVCVWCVCACVCVEREISNQKSPSAPTLLKVQRLGSLDPVAVELDEAMPFSLKNPEHGPKILDIVHQLAIGDEDVGLDEDGLFGLRPTDRDRGMNLFRGGNVVAESVQFASATLRSSSGRKVWVVSGDVVASQRGRVYRVTVVFDKETGKALDKPAGSCECVAHLGWCSHQLALGFLFLMFLKSFPRDTTCDEFLKVYPPSPFLAQREGCPWSHATSDKTKECTKCFDKLKFGRAAKKIPKNKRDVVQLLVPRVQEWAKKWQQETAGNTERRHAFARKQVLTIFDTDTHRHIHTLTHLLTHTHSHTH